MFSYFKQVCVTILSSMSPTFSSLTPSSSILCEHKFSWLLKCLWFYFTKPWHVSGVVHYTMLAPLWPHVCLRYKRLYLGLKSFNTYMWNKYKPQHLGLKSKLAPTPSNDTLFCTIAYKCFLWYHVRTNVSVRIGIVWVITIHNVHEVLKKIFSHI